MKRIGTALWYIDELIWLLICLAGVAAVVIAIVGGASVIEVGLILMWPSSRRSSGRSAATCGTG